MIPFPMVNQPTQPARSNAAGNEVLDEYKNLIKAWEEGRMQNGFDPIPVLEKMSSMIEKEANMFWRHDHDPFDSRHPIHIEPKSLYGTLLSVFFKKESLLQDLVSNYLREDFWRSHHSEDETTHIIGVSLRLTISLLPGLEDTTLLDTPELATRLYKWAENGPEPLMTYSLGLLAVINELEDFPKCLENRSRNEKLALILIQKLRNLLHETKEELDKTRKDFKRPFSMFSQNHGSPAKRPRVSSTDTEPQKSPQFLQTSPPASPIGVSSIHNTNSNSSWAEMESHVIDHFSIHPISNQTKQIFILRLLKPLFEYQEFVAIIVAQDVISLFKDLLSFNVSRDSRLTFEALKVMASMFCHKKLILDWIGIGGIQILLDVPMPSFAICAVTQCLWFIACDDDSLEKVCQLPEHLLSKLIEYVTWCMERSYNYARQFAIMFCGAAAASPILLDILDEHDIVRYLYNTIGSLKILNPDDATNDLFFSEDEEIAERQTLRQSTLAFKRYFEAQVGKKSDELRRLNRKSGQIGDPNRNKLQKYSQEQVIDNVETIMAFLPFRFKWSPVENFWQLGGISKCLQIVASAYDWAFVGRADIVRSTLDVLYMCSVSPRVQLCFCDQMNLADDNKTIAINIILSAAEGEIVQDSADVRRSALYVLINCVCAPIIRPGSIPKQSSTVNSSVKKIRSSEDVINKLWNYVRANNGIMIFLDLLHIKSPITDADSIRALACKALVGLARSESAKQIMSKLPIFSTGQLQQLVREPVLQDKRQEHVAFQQYAHELMNMVSEGLGDPRRVVGSGNSNDFSLEMLHRASVVAQTRIKFPKKQLLKLIQDYLHREGLHETASVLRRESDLDSINVPNKGLMHNRSNAVAAQSPTPTTAQRSRLLMSPMSASNFANKSVIANASPSSSQTLTSTSSNDLHASCHTPTNPPIKFNRLKSETPTVSPSFIRDKNMALLKSADSKRHSDSIERSPNKPTVTLDSIVSDYLSSQHSLCKNPMMTCPEFDLFVPHKCPDPRSKSSAPLNFCTRYSHRSFFPPCGGLEGQRMDRKLVYGRFRPIRALKAISQNELDKPLFTSCSMMPQNNVVLAGTCFGDIQVIDVNGSTISDVYPCLESDIYYIESSRDGKNFIACSKWRRPYCGMFQYNHDDQTNPFELKMSFGTEEYLEYSKLNQDMVIGTANDVATIYDVATQKLIRKFKPDVSNGYLKNRATFDHSDDLVLNDGVLYDMRESKEIRKLDKLNPYLSGVFHPNKMEIVSNAEVWDLRTFQLIKTVPGLEECSVRFNSDGTIIYAHAFEKDVESEEEEPYESSFKTFDAHDYSSIATIETKRFVVDLCPSASNLKLAVVENPPNRYSNEESLVKIYQVGNLKIEEDREEEEEEEDEDGREEPINDNDFSFDSEFEEIFGSNDEEEDDEGDEDQDEEGDDDQDEEGDDDQDEEGDDDGDEEGDDDDGDEEGEDDGDEETDDDQDEGHDEDQDEDQNDD